MADHCHGRWWHYTTSRKLFQIIAAERIRRPRVMVQTGERLAVWFTSRETWEPTASKAVVPVGATSLDEMRKLTALEMVDVAGQLVRLEVPEEIARHSWAKHRQIGGIDSRVADRLEAGAREDGSDPNQWRVSYHDVPILEVLGVEASDDGERWVVVGVPSDTGFRMDTAFVERARWAARGGHNKG